ncbi:hypothetical protein CEW88_15655 [Alloyangia pacifica]|uniref:Restriction endonuclease type IV Mrr domain-containing protein n=1 Tax=Alloyangia pacifica TaxID=311180 RepID=A0A2U8HHH5_9RHOB|nr:restriction endonuclease [Alloyangia pacifica]AWI85181.1 hypothetical protein CEW88_15655 [Alloyangia pacifica]
MPAPSKATYFERRVARVFEAVEKLGVEVTWNAKIKDPHTHQTRQIDVILKHSNGRTTCVECRDRASVQDVMWIEELSGRQRSMNFDNVFAVSSSGFTQPAIAKAQALGVTLFKLSSFEVEATEIALAEPAVYILCADQVNIQCFAKSDLVSKDELQKLLSQKFTLEFERFYKAIEGLNSSGNGTIEIGQHAVRTTSFTTTNKFDGVDVDFQYVLQARLFWHRFELKPYYFRKLKPGEVSTSAEIYDDEMTSGITAEFILTERRFDINLDYHKNNDWHDRYHFCSAQIFHESLLNKKIRVRQSGRTQIHFSFKYEVL